MKELETCTRWNGLDLVVKVIDFDNFSDGIEVTAAEIELDYRFNASRPHPADEAMRMVKAMIDENQERYLEKIKRSRVCQEDLAELIQGHLFKEAEQLAYDWR